MLVGAGVIGGEAVGDRIKVQSRKTSGEGVTVAETAVIVLCVEEGDLQTSMTEQLS